MGSTSYKFYITRKWNQGKAAKLLLEHGANFTSLENGIKAKLRFAASYNNLDFTSLENGIKAKL